LPLSVLGLKERLAKALGPQIAGDLAITDTADINIEGNVFI
jgi:hypothetical protein